MSDELKFSRRKLLGTMATTMAGIATGVHSSVARAASRPAPPRTLPERREFIIKNAYVITMDPKLGEIRRGDIHARDGAIVSGITTVANWKFGLLAPAGIRFGRQCKW